MFSLKAWNVCEFLRSDLDYAQILDAYWADVYHKNWTNIRLEDYNKCVVVSYLLYAIICHQDHYVHLLVGFFSLPPFSDLNFWISCIVSTDLAIKLTFRMIKELWSRDHLRIDRLNTTIFSQRQFDESSSPNWSVNADRKEFHNCISSLP